MSSSKAHDNMADILKKIQGVNPHLDYETPSAAGQDVSGELVDIFMD